LGAYRRPIRRNAGAIFGYKISGNLHDDEKLRCISGLGQSERTAEPDNDLAVTQQHNVVVVVDGGGYFRRLEVDNARTLLLIVVGGVVGGGLGGEGSGGGVPHVGEVLDGELYALAWVNCRDEVQHKQKRFRIRLCAGYRHVACQ